MKRNIGLFLLTVLLVTGARAEDAATGNSTEPVVNAKSGLISSVLAQVMKPVNWTQANVVDAYPRASVSVATFVAIWAACRVYKPLGQTLFGCKADKTREREEREFAF